MTKQWYFHKKSNFNEEKNNEEVVNTVSEVLRDIRENGYEAVQNYARKYDGWTKESFRLSKEEIDEIISSVDEKIKSNIDFAHSQISKFALAQKNTLSNLEIEMHPGITLGHKLVPVQQVGCYVPGGRYPLIASALMTITVAKVAGVKRIIACAPPSSNGQIQAEQLYAIKKAGADEVYCLGGIQAMGFMAYGTDDSNPVDMIVGAGNAYVAEAKRQLFGTVGIDLLAGPSEVLVIGDEMANADLIAKDLLAQAEHGPTSQVILVTDSTSLAERVEKRVLDLLNTDWPTSEVAKVSWEARGEIIVCENREVVLEVANQIASEHVELQTQDNEYYFENLVNYGSLFIGENSTVAFGDKGIGTNHVLPTSKAAKYTGGLSVYKFLKNLTYQKVSDEGVTKIADHLASICDAEMMDGHAISIRERLKECSVNG